MTVEKTERTILISSAYDGAIHPEIKGKKVESMDEIRFSRGKKIPLSKTSYDALPPPKERLPQVNKTDLNQPSKNQTSP